MAAEMKIKANTGEVHEVQKYINGNDGLEHIWCNTWYGHHIIGQDCELYTDPAPFENALKQEPVQAVMMVIMRYLTDEQRKIVWEKLGRRVDQSIAITDLELTDETERLYPKEIVIGKESKVQFTFNEVVEIQRHCYGLGRKKSIARERELEAEVKRLNDLLSENSHHP